MFIIKLAVNGQHIRIYDTDMRRLPPVTDTYNYFKCQFTFDDSWDGFDKRVYFKNTSYNIAKPAIVDASGYCFIPWEVVAHTGVITCSVTGIKYVDGFAERITTNPAYIFTMRSEGIIEPYFQPDPTLSEYEQFVQLVKDYRDEALAAKDEVIDIVANLDYDSLNSRPTIEGVLLSGDLTFDDLNLVAITTGELDEILV